MTRRRADALLVERGLADSRERARALILAGEVWSGEQRVAKAGQLLPLDAPLSVAQPPPYVSRGGLKLEHALSEFRLDASGMVALDVGASTGGFTDCLLKRGATRVYALDVGYGQIDLRLRSDPRVVVIERLNARYPFALPEIAGLATVDVSFISVEKVLPSISAVLHAHAPTVVLLKPQFEAGRREVGKGGLVRDPQVHARVLGRFIAWAVHHRFRVRGLVPSPILGASGNREFFVLLEKRA